MEPLNSRSENSPREGQAKLIGVEKAVEQVNHSERIFNYIFNRVNESPYNLDGRSLIMSSCSEYTGPVRLATNYTWQTHFQDLIRDMKREVAANKDTKQGLVERLDRVNDLLPKRIEKLIADELIEPISASLFVSQAWAMGNFGKTYRDAITAISGDKHRDPNADREKYLEVIAQIIKQTPIDQIQHQQEYVVINPKGFEPQGKIYLSVAPDQKPSEVLILWNIALKMEKLADKVTYKFSNTGRHDHYDNIVIYTNPDVDAQVARALQRFNEFCPGNFLNRDGIPTGQIIAPGLTYAPESPLMMDIHNCLGSKGVSYHNLISSLFTGSLLLAHSLLDESERKRITPPTVFEKLAKEYFNQMMLLTGVDPKTLEPIDSYNSPMPAVFREFPAPVSLH